MTSPVREAARSFRRLGLVIGRTLAAIMPGVAGVAVLAGQWDVAAAYGCWALTGVALWVACVLGEPDWARGNS